MAQGLTSTQEIVEVRLDNFMRGSIKDALAQELAARPEPHRRAVPPSQAATSSTASCA